MMTYERFHIKIGIYSIKLLCNHFYLRVLIRQVKQAVIKCIAVNNQGKKGDKPEEDNVDSIERLIKRKATSRVKYTFINKPDVSVNSPERSLFDFINRGTLIVFIYTEEAA